MPSTRPSGRSSSRHRRRRTPERSLGRAFARRPSSSEEILRRNPFETPPRYEKLLWDLAGAYSRRINLQHRLVYQVLKDERTVKVLRMWTHYE